MLKRNISEIDVEESSRPEKKQKIETKWCPECDSYFDIEIFRKICNACFKKKNLQRDRLRVQKQRKFLQDLKDAAGGCFDCKSNDRLEFAHYDRNTKYRTKSGKLVGIGQLSIRLMKEEVKKGRFLCHRCHVYETEQEQKALKILEKDMTPVYKKRQKIFQDHYQYIVTVKINLRSCFDCVKLITNDNHREFEFDHVPERGEKFKCVSHMTAYSIERIDAEIKKCDLVCFGCHKIRTAKRLCTQPNFGVTFDVPALPEKKINVAKNLEDFTQQDRIDKLIHIKNRCEIITDKFNIVHWIWSGSKNSSGSGTIGFHKQSYAVHKLSFMLENNLNSLDILKRLCDYKLCVNPEHIEKVM